ncbi:hypothetical protein CBL_04057 [Carabus blaptoides fortunei]
MDTSVLFMSVMQSPVKDDIPFGVSDALLLIRAHARLPANIRLDSSCTTTSLPVQPNILQFCPAATTITHGSAICRSCTCYTKTSRRIISYKTHSHVIQIGALTAKDTPDKTDRLLSIY